MNLSFQWH